ncbi:MAG TPA: hypothetical protein VFK13_07960 [Gemmatimonadaceae bacterium]|nr:hypothetical protein [Gemmatimonadaceae bacterium]
MCYTPPDRAGGWQLLEVVRGTRRPSSDAYCDANDRELATILRQLRLLRLAGCPPERGKGRPRYEKLGQCTFEGRSVGVYVLKAKPSPWRLYFFVPDREHRRIVFLHSVSKKRDKRDAQDLVRCSTLIGALERGAYSLQEVEIPPV